MRALGSFRCSVAGTGWCGLALLVFLLAPPPGAATQAPGEVGQEPDSKSVVEEGQEEEAPQEETPPEDRSRFEFPFDEEVGGGKATGLAEVVEFDGDERARLVGRVEVLYQDLRFRADQVELDQENKILTAVGNVILDEGPRRLSGASLRWDLEAETGTLTEASGQVSSDYYFKGSEIQKVGENTYTIIDGEFTSCDQDVPAWSFSLSRATITVDAYARTKNATLRFKRVPVLRIPYMLWPVRSERSSGLLIPKPGYSTRRGASLSLAYYQVLGPSYDTTLEVDLFSESGYFGIGNEFRYQPTPGTKGNLRGYLVRQPDDPRFGLAKDTRWRVRYDHESNQLPLGLRAVLSVDEVSDFQFFQDFERRTDRNSQRQLYSKGFLTGNWGGHSLNFLVDQRETLVQGDETVLLRQLPEIEYKLRSTRLGKTPIYLQMRSALHYLDVERSASQATTYGRADFFPQFTVPVRAWSWLSLSFTVGGRLTWYEDSLLTLQEREEIGEQSTGSDFRGEALTRTVSTASAEIVGPSLSRIFEGKGKHFDKYKHVIEPRLTYNFFDDFDERQRIPLFDEVDNLRGRNVGRFTLANRLLAKPPEEEGGGAREILSLELFQDYSFDTQRPLQEAPDGRELQEGPIGTLLRFNPSNQTTLKTELRYNTLFGRLVSRAVSGSFSFYQHQVGLRWSTRIGQVDGATQNDQVRFSTRLALVPNKLDLNALVNYDLNQGMTQLQRYIVNYRARCYTLNLELADFRAGPRRDREYRFALTLKNVGTFFEITGGQSETL